MQAPCKTCDRRTIDFGGCRCQALLLAGDAATTDPVCTLSPNRPKVDAILTDLNNSVGAGFVYAEPPSAPPADATLTEPAWLYRPNPA
jgi:pyrroloquinoline quinone biosynthesis protein E